MLSPSFDELNHDDFDAIIVGSDQIWRPKYFIRLWGGKFSNAFLDFTSSWNVRRIAYAVSFGSNELEIPIAQIDLLSKLCDNFYSISVREKDGLELCSRYLSVHAEQVLDPTLLLNMTDYLSISRGHRENNTYTQLFCYVLDRNDEINDLIEIVSKNKGVPPFFFNNNNIQDNIESRVYKTVERWIQSFVEAEFIITDSYHACVFSILFQKPFVVLGNKNRGLSRFSSLLEMFGLSANFLLQASDYNPNCKYEVDPSSISILNDMREKSISFLHDSLTL